MIEIKNKEQEINSIELPDIKDGTVFLGDIEDFPNIIKNNLFLKIYDPDHGGIIISLYNPKKIWTNLDCTVKNFKEVDIEITIF